MRIPGPRYISSGENRPFVNGAPLTFLAGRNRAPGTLIALRRRSQPEVPHHPFELRPQLRQLGT
jgi:hypothetical protein